MKNLLGLYACLIIIFVLSESGCKKEEEDACLPSDIRTELRPTAYRSFAEIRHNIAAESSIPIRYSGTICLYGDYVFVNEQGKGVHILEVGTSGIRPISYIPIIGNYDIAAHNGVLYANNYNDLVLIDISDINNPQFIRREENLLPIFAIDSVEGVAYEWGFVRVTDNPACEHLLRNSPAPEAVASSVADAVETDEDYYKNGRTGSSNTKGAFGRFAIAGDYLYIAANRNILVYDISAPANVREVNRLAKSAGNLFVAGNHLFIYGFSYTIIFDITNPSNPQEVSSFWYDPTNSDPSPVCVSDGYAYVSVRDAEVEVDSQTTIEYNQLKVFSLANIDTPRHISTVDVFEPWGLNVQNDVLYLCQGGAGLYVFGVADKRTIGRNLYDRIDNIHARDVIVSPDRPFIIVVGGGRCSVFDNSDPRNLRLIDAF